MKVSKFYVNDEISTVPNGTGGTAMTFGSMYMASGIYTLGGQSWDCTRPGLYRFLTDTEPFFRQRIVFGATVPTMDIYSLISAVCWNHIHGSADEGLDVQTRSNRGVNQRWRLRCGVIVADMVWLLPQFSQTARSINVKTLGPLNGFDDGHIVLETQHSGVWRMWDLTNGCYWRDSNGVHMSTAQFVAQIANNGPMPTKVRLDGSDHRWDAETATVSGGILDLGLYGELIIDPSPEAWFRRIFQVIY